MSRIRIEEKNNRPFLPWVLGLILLVLVGFGIATLWDDDDLDDVAYTEMDANDGMDDNADRVNYVEIEGENGYRNVVNNYLSFTRDMEGEMGLGHEFSHRAMTLLASATASVARNHGLDERVEVQERIARIEQSADELKQEPYTETHANNIRDMAQSITEILAAVDVSVYNDRNAAGIQALRQEARRINAETLTLNQKQDVRGFFRQAREVLMDMS